MMQPKPNEVPEPGIYENVPFEEYLAWPCVSNSALSHAERSMLHFHERRPIEETDAMAFGTLCHTGKLEPSAIFRRYVVMPDLTQGIVNADGKPSVKPRATKEYDRRVEEFTARHPDKQVVTQADFDAMVGVVSAIDAHRRAREVFAQGKSEVAIVWDDPTTGIRCKGRMDKLALERERIGDLKTNRDCLKFHTTIANRGYHRQGALYIDGVRELTGVTCTFWLVAAESEHPFGVMAAPICDDDIEAGREEYKQMLRDVKRCRESNVWPGYESPTEWRMPAWKSSEPLTLTFEGKAVTL